jgi:hypothetical protein
VKLNRLSLLRPGFFVKVSSAEVTNFAVCLCCVRCACSHGAQRVVFGKREQAATLELTGRQYAAVINSTCVAVSPAS